MLKRQIGTLGLLLIGVGSMIGSGWLFGPFFAAQIAGPAAIFSWVIGGGMTMLLALTFAELSSAFPFSGGIVYYMRLSHGPLVGFSMAWVSWISAVVVAPVETLAILHYAASYFPQLMHRMNEEYVVSGLGFGVGAVLMMILCIVNAYGVAKLTKANNVITLLKFAVPLLTIVSLVAVSFHVSNFTVSGFAPMGLKAILAALPSAGIIYSFIGFNNAVILGGEVKNPQRSFPIALLGALIICIILYTLLQIVFVGALFPADFHNGWQHLNFSRDVGPFAGIAITLGLAWLATIIYLDAIVSPYGTALVYTGATARLFYAMTRNSYAPTYFSRLNRFGIPWRIILLNYFVGLLLFLPFPSWQKMMNFLVIAFVFSYAVGPLSLIVLRKTLPDQPRPFRLPAANILSFLAFYICNLIIYWAGWVVVYKVLIAIFLGYIVYFLGVKEKIVWKVQWQKSWWFFLYLILMGVLSYLSAFGGGQGRIPFGWDFLIMLIFSAIIYYAASHCCLTPAEANEEFQQKKKDL